MADLIRSIKVPGAVLMGLGSILGTGVFVSLAFATQVIGSSIILAIILAGFLAIANGLSSAQLAAVHPVSGGTYEYGYRFLGSYWGFSAGWLFLLAKSASAATAIIGTTSYAFQFLGIDANYLVYQSVNIFILIMLTWLVAGGIQRSNLVNKIIVSITLTGLLSLVFMGLTQSTNSPTISTIFDFENDFSNLFYASALMFVAFTGYGRIATLGEEVVNPSKTIPKAIILTLFSTLILYAGVAYTAIHVMGAESFGNTINSDAAPLVQVASYLNSQTLITIVSVSAITAMIGGTIKSITGYIQGGSWHVPAVGFANRTIQNTSSKWEPCKFSLFHRDYHIFTCAHWRHQDYLVIQRIYSFGILCYNQFGGIEDPGSTKTLSANSFSNWTTGLPVSRFFCGCSGMDYRAPTLAGRYILALYYFKSEFEPGLNKFRLLDVHHLFDLYSIRSNHPA
jgi:amino acid transporter